MTFFSASIRRFSEYFLILFLLSFSIVIITQPFVFRFIYEILSPFTPTELDIGARQRISQIMVERLNDTQVFTLEFSDANQLFLSIPEIQHMNEVQTVLGYLKLFALCSGVILIGVFVYYRKRNSATLYNLKVFLQRTRASYGLISFLLSVNIALLWTQFFTFFHTVLFPNGNWSFPAESTLIRVYPEFLWKELFVICIFFPLASIQLALLLIQISSRVFNRSFLFPNLKK